MVDIALFLSIIALVLVILNLLEPVISCLYFSLYNWLFPLRGSSVLKTESKLTIKSDGNGEFKSDRDLDTNLYRVSSPTRQFRFKAKER